MGFIDKFRGFGSTTKEPQKDEVGVFNASNTTPSDRLPLLYNWFWSANLGMPRQINIVELRQYAKSAWVQMVKATIKKQMMTIPWDVVVADEEDETDYDKDIMKVKNFLEHPNRNGDTFWDVWGACADDVLDLDAGVVFKGRNMDGELVELFAYDGGRFLFDVDPYGIINGYYQYSFRFPRAAPLFFKRDELIYLKVGANTENYPYGWSPLQSIVQEVEVMIQSTRYNKEFFINNAKPDGIVTMKGNKDELDRVQKSWLHKIKGQAHKLLFLNNTDVDFKQLSTNLKEMEWLEGQKWYFHVVFGAYGLSPQEAGFYENSNKSTGESQERITVKNAIKPYLTLISNAINSEIIPELVGHTKIQFDWFPEDDAAEKNEHEQRMTKLVNNVYTINEVRALEGLKPVEWGDKPFAMAMQENMVEQSNSFNDDNSDDNKKDDRDNKEDRDKKKNERDKKKTKNFKKKVVEPLDDPITKGSRVIAIGPRGGRIVGYHQGKPIYEGSPEDKKRQARRMEQDNPVESQDFSQQKLIDGMKDYFKDKTFAELVKGGGRSSDKRDALMSLGLDKESAGRRHQEIFFRAYEKEIYDSMVKFTAISSTDESPPGFNYYLGSLGIAIKSDTWNDTTVTFDEISNELRKRTGNDVKHINTVLKYMTTKKRVKKDGWKNSPNAKSVDEIKSSLEEREYKGIKYKVSKTYVKNSTQFNTQEEMDFALHQVLDNLPEKAKKSINSGDTKIHFVNRNEAKKISNANSSSNALGYYMTGSKQIFIFPQKSTNTRVFGVESSKLKSAGYDDAMIMKIQTIQNVDSWKHTVIHELAHAAGLNTNPDVANMSGKIQEDYDKIYDKHREKDLPRMSTETWKKTFITDYARTNSHEDFAETFAFYSQNKGVIDKELASKKGVSIFHANLLEKFRFMRDKIWS